MKVLKITDTIGLPIILQDGKDTQTEIMLEYRAIIKPLSEYRLRLPSALDRISLYVQGQNDQVYPAEGAFPEPVLKDAYKRVYESLVENGFIIEPEE